MRVMRGTRNLAFAGLLLSLVLVGRSAPAVAASSRSDCVLPEGPYCADYPAGDCQAWPQSGCYLAVTQSQVSQGVATAVCQLYVAESGCGMSAEAVPEGTCWWFCQWEGPGDCRQE